MFKSTKAKIGLVVLLVIFLVLLIVFTRGGSKKKTTATNAKTNQSNLNTATSVTPPDTSLPGDALQVVKDYTQARENSVSVTQSTPSSWVNGVKSMVTDDWFQKLQPPSGDMSTGTTPYDYTVAHDNNYIVQANVNGCQWNLALAHPTDTSGIVDCTLSDTTINKKTGKTVDASATPFGWSRTGPQPPLNYTLVKQNGKWLIASDGGAAS